MNGVILKITGRFTLNTVGFAANGLDTTPTASCTWGVGKCNSGLSDGHWAVNIGLMLNTVPSTDTTYTVSVGFGVPPFTAGVCNGICFSASTPFLVPSTATASSTMNFFFDTGGTTIPSIQALTIAVA